MRHAIAMGVVGIAVSALAVVSVQFNQGFDAVDFATAENIFGAQVVEPIDPGGGGGVHPDHHSHVLWAPVDCAKKEPKDCYYCVGSSYEPACNGGTVCQTKQKYIFRGGYGNYRKKEDPETTYCSRKICNGQYTYCGSWESKMECGKGSVTTDGLNIEIQ